MPASEKIKSTPMKRVTQLAIIAVVMTLTL
jgi:hypothetical protein